jgi:hydrogenase maturation protein HypF
MADLRDFKRLGHLNTMPLAGGDAAARDPRRCGLAMLMQAFGASFRSHALARRMVPDDAEREFLTGMLEGNVRCVASTAAGRVFDGVAALLGVCLHNTHEAEAAMKLEALACGGAWIEGEADYFEVVQGQPLRIDLAPLVQELVNRIERQDRPENLAAFFHRQFAGAWAAVTRMAAASTGLNTVALSGGVFCNEILTKELTRRLQQSGMKVLRHRLVPPNDGGIALGQAAVASARMGELVEKSR